MSDYVKRQLNNSHDSQDDSGFLDEQIQYNVGANTNKVDDDGWDDYPEEDEEYEAPFQKPADGIERIPNRQGKAKKNYNNKKTWDNNKNPQQKYYKNNDSNTNKAQTYNHGNNHQSDNYNPYQNNYGNKKFNYKNDRHKNFDNNKYGGQEGSRVQNNSERNYNQTKGNNDKTEKKDDIIDEDLFEEIEKFEEKNYEQENNPKQYDGYNSYNQKKKVYQNNDHWKKNNHERNFQQNNFNNYSQQGNNQKQRKPYNNNQHYNNNQSFNNNQHHNANQQQDNQFLNNQYQNYNQNQNNNQYHNNSQYHKNQYHNNHPQNNQHQSNQYNTNPNPHYKNNFNKKHNQNQNERGVELINQNTAQFTTSTAQNIETPTQKPPQKLEIKSEPIIQDQSKQPDLRQIPPKYNNFIPKANLNIVSNEDLSNKAYTKRNPPSQITQYYNNNIFFNNNINMNSQKLGIPNNIPYNQNVPIQGIPNNQPQMRVPVPNMQIKQVNLGVKPQQSMSSETNNLGEIIKKMDIHADEYIPKAKTVPSNAVPNMVNSNTNNMKGNQVFLNTNIHKK